MKLRTSIGILFLSLPASADPAPPPVSAGTQLPFAESTDLRQARPTARRWFRIGRGHLERGDYERARACLESAVRCDPRLIGAYKGLAKAWTHLGRPGRAIEVLEEAIRINPVPEGTDSSGRRLQVEPTLWLYVDLAQIHRRRGNLGAAIRTLRESLARDPGFWSASRILARLTQEAGDEGGADRVIEAAFERLSWPPEGPGAAERRASAVKAVRALYGELGRPQDGLKFRRN